MTLQAVRKPFFLGVSVGCAGATLFFGYYGVQLVYTALTFEGEGSLGHVGMYIAAGLFPLGALICGALTYLAWKAAHRRRPGSATPA